MAQIKKSKSMDKLPARKMPEGVKFPKNKNAVPNPPGVQRTPTSGTKKPLPKTITKTPVKKKVQVMPDKISPSKMTPAQKARYLKNPERYDG
jgi:hypothetical protein